LIYSYTQHTRWDRTEWKQITLWVKCCSNEYEQHLT